MSIRAHLVILLAGLIQSASLAVSPDEHTLFYASFNDGLAADFSRGMGAVTAQGELVPGKVGRAVAIRQGRLSYPALGNLQKSEGTVELWLRPVWIGTTTRPPVIFTFSTPEGGYLTLNTVAETRFGVAIRNHAADPFVWRRVERSIDDWQPDQWHHVAVAWTASTLRLYVDGEEVPEAVLDHAGLDGEPGSFGLGGPGVDLDEVRISDVARPAAEIKANFENPGSPEMIRHLSSLPVDAVEPNESEVGMDVQPAQDEARLPLIVAGRHLPRGIGLYSNQSISWQVPADAVRLQGVLGISDLSEAEGTVSAALASDGQALWKGELRAGQAAQPVNLDLAGVKRLTLTTSASGRHMVVFGMPVLLKPNAMPFPDVTAPVAPETLELARMKRDAGKAAFPLPQTDKGYVLWSKSIEDEQANDQAPVGELWPKELRLFATPGETEPVGLVLAAAKALPVTLAVTDLKSDAGTIPASEIDLGLVARQPMRKLYPQPAVPGNFSIVPRFIFPYKPFTLAPGTMREIFVDVHVPETAAAGVYRGQLTVNGGGQTTVVEIVCRVLPIRLAESPKQYGMYYRMSDTLDSPERLEAELSDMQRHGITVMWPGMGIGISMADGQPQFDYAPIRRMLTALKAHGFHGPIIVEDSLMGLARAMGKKFAPGQLDPTVETDEAYLAAAKQMLDGLLAVQKEFPEFELVLSHMDEVFGRDRLPLFLQFARVAKKLSPMRLYITMHTTPGSPWRDYFAQVTPYVDIPCFNGHALDSYLKDGGSWQELGKLLADNKQEGWTYYNIRGSFFTAEWMRIVNGLYMWQAPLRVHIPWMYYSFTGDPFDDTDSDRHDFAYAAPSREDPTVMIPTLHYKAMREGADDARYIYTLKQLIETQRATKPAAAAEGQKVLDEIAAILPAIPADLQEISQESPWLVAISARLSGKEYNVLRWRVAEAIMKLQP